MDDQRIGLLRELIGTFCSEPDEAEARSLLAFRLRIGEHFLAADLILTPPRAGGGQHRVLPEG